MRALLMVLAFILLVGSASAQVPLRPLAPDEVESAIDAGTHTLPEPYRLRARELAVDGRVVWSETLAFVTTPYHRVMVAARVKWLDVRRRLTVEEIPPELLEPVVHIVVPDLARGWDCGGVLEIAAFPTGMAKLNPSFKSDVPDGVRAVRPLWPLWQAGPGSDAAVLTAREPYYPEVSRHVVAGYPMEILHEDIEFALRIRFRDDTCGRPSVPVGSLLHISPEDVTYWR